MPPLDAIEPLLDRKRAARLLGIHENTLHPEIKRGEIPSVRIGKRVMIDPRDLRDYIEARKTNGPAVARQAVPSAAAGGDGSHDGT